MKKVGILISIALAFLFFQGQVPRSGAKVTKNTYVRFDTGAAYSEGKPVVWEDTVVFLKVIWMDSVPPPGDCPPTGFVYFWYGGIGKVYVRYSDCTQHNIDSAGTGGSSFVFSATGFATLSDSARLTAGTNITSITQSGHEITINAATQTGAMSNQTVLDTLNNLTASPDIFTDVHRYTGAMGFWGPDTFRNNPPRSINTAGGILRTEQWGASASAAANDATAVGNLASAAGATSTAVGSAASANTTDATAIGAGASTVGARTTMVGSGARNTGTTANNNTIVGWNSRLSNGADSNTIVGANSLQQTGHDGGVLIGSEIDARGHHTVLIGNFSKTGTGTADAGVAVGDHAVVGNNSVTTSNNVAIGYTSTATASGAIAIGAPANATNDHTGAFGHGTLASGTDATALGYNASATHREATVLGTASVSTKTNQVVLGRDRDTAWMPGYTQHLGAIALIETTMAQITADQNNYSIGNFGAARISTDASRNITGFLGGRRGKTVHYFNVGSTDAVVKNQDAGSTDTCRVITGSGGDLIIGADQSAQFWYDGTTKRWRRIQ